MTTKNIIRTLWGSTSLLGAAISLQCAWGAGRYGGHALFTLGILLGAVVCILALCISHPYLGPGEDAQD